MKHFSRAILGVAALALLAFVIHGCSASFDADDARRAKESIEWRQFSAEHHCHVACESSFFELTETWRCDGFDVKR